MAELGFKSPYSDLLWKSSVSFSEVLCLQVGKSQYRSHSSYLLTFTNNDDDGDDFFFFFDGDDYNAYLLCVHVILASGVCFKKARKIPALVGKERQSV